jgi:hypothetical protein
MTPSVTDQGGIAPLPEIRRLHLALPQAQRRDFLIFIKP